MQKSGGEIKSLLMVMKKLFFVFQAYLAGGVLSQIRRKWSAKFSLNNRVIEIKREEG